MFQNARRVHTLLASATGLTLVLGVGVAVGAVPRPVTTQSAASVTAAPTEGVGTDAGATAAATANAEPVATEAPATEAPTTVPEAPTTTAAPAAAPKAADPEPAPAAADPAPITPAMPAPSGSTGPTIAVRANPTSAQVQAAIQQIATRIPFFSVASEAQARQFGDAVCAAFDQGNSYSQVKTQVQQALAVLPMVTVKPADMDFAIRTAVQLFCPGYTSKLV